MNNDGGTPRFMDEATEIIKYKELFRVTEKFHSSMNINSVLSEIIQTLRKVFPEFDYDLLLSNDHDAETDLPIKRLEYNSNNKLAIAAFVNGKVELDEDNELIMYAPLRGKQGVYGVLKVLSGQRLLFTQSQIDFIGLLANTAGSALENAKLYQQSQQLVDDLRLIDETTQKLNSTSSLEETIDYLQQQISRSFQTTNIGFILINNDTPEVLKGSSKYFSKNCSLIHSVWEKLDEHNDSLFIGEMKHMPECVQAEYASLMAVPMKHGADLNGFVIVLGEQPYSFSFDMFKLFQSLIQRSTLAVANSMLREKLEAMVVTDYLTQLHTRNYLNNQIEFSMKNDRQGTLILMDLDDFKQINDTYGHQKGDEVLLQVAEIIRQKLRTTDIGARWGGEELAVYLPNTPIENGYKVAKRLVSQVSIKTSPNITVSCGVSTWNSESPDTIKDLFHRADVALYDAKHAGKNQVFIYKSQSQSKNGIA